jgi:hypothetical protein
MASLSNDAVFSILLLRVLGLVEVVPKLCCRPCPRRNAPGDVGDVGVGKAGEGAPEEPGEGIAPETTEFSSIEPRGVGLVSSTGVTGLESSPRASSGSTRSGGRRSFSISDFRLLHYQ